MPNAHHHKVLTYIEYRAVSGVFQTIDPPTPSSPPSECVLPPHQSRRGPHSPGGQGVGVQHFGRRQTLDWPLTVKSLYATHTLAQLAGHRQKGSNTRQQINRESAKCGSFCVIDTSFNTVLSLFLENSQ